MLLSRQYQQIKKYLKENGNRGDVKMSNFGSIIMITLLVTAFSYFLVGGSILTLEDPPKGGPFVIPQMPKQGQTTNALQLTTFGGTTVAPIQVPNTPKPTSVPIPTQPTDATGVPASISVKIGCSARATVTFQFSLTNPQSPTYNITVIFPTNEKIPNAALTLSAGATKIVDTGKAALASGPLYFNGLPDGRGPKNFPSRICAIPTPTPF